MLTGMEFDSAGLAARSAEQQWRGGWLVANSAIQFATEGVRDTCSGSVEQSLEVCQQRATDSVCDSCNREFGIIVRFSVPSARTTTPHHTAANEDHPSPGDRSFDYDQGVSFQYDDGSLARTNERGDLISDHE